jgi:glutamate carboxypeptidase
VNGAPTSAQGDVLERVAARGAEIIDRAVDWAGIASGSRNLSGLEQQRVALAQVLGELPGTLESLPLEPTMEVDAAGREVRLDHPDALRLTVRPEAPVQVVLTGHYDTVYPEGSAFHMSTRPDGALQGPGIADMKGGISVMLAALEALEAFEAKATLGYRVLLSPDEELGSPASAPLLAELGRLGHVGLTYEPALGDGALAAARKGSGNFHVLIRGKAAHAGRDFASGRNALAAATRLARALDDLNGHADGLTLNLARIDGGGPLNVVPDTAVVRFNVRAPDLASLARAQAAIERAVEAVQDDGITARLLGGFTRPPKPFVGAQHALFQAIVRTGDLIGQTVSWKDSGGVCEGNNLFASGLPNADSLGVRGGDIHSENEHAWPDSFVERAQLSALVLMRLATGEIDGPGLRTQLARELA